MPRGNCGETQGITMSRMSHLDTRQNRRITAERPPNAYIRRHEERRPKETNPKQQRELLTAADNATQYSNTSPHIARDPRSQT